jgi:signal transduction histidine kinase
VTVRLVSLQRLRRSLRHARQRAALEQERARISRDIHDDVSNQLTEIVLVTSMARRKYPEAIARSCLDQIAGSTQKVIKSLDEIVWAINPSNDTLSHLVSYIGQFASNFLNMAEISCRLNLPSDPPDCSLPSNIRHNLFLATKEAIHNAVQHAKATEVLLSIEIDGSMLRIMVEDNGCGFDGSAGGLTSDGLSNMQYRMAVIGGTFAIESRKEQGTQVILCLVFHK